MKIIQLSFSVIVCFMMMTLCMQSTMSQTLSIGNETNEKSIPYNPYYEFSYSQSIFDQTEINLAGVIDSIRFFYNGNSSFTDNPVKIYLGTSLKSSFSSGTDWIDISTLTLVYSGPVSTTTTAEWVGIDISDYPYTNSKNLVVAVHETQSGFHTSDDDFYATACTGNKTIYKTQDTNPINPSTPPTGTTQAYRPNIQIVFGSSTPMSYVSSTCTQASTDPVYIGETIREIIRLEIETSGTSNQLEVSQLNINMNGSTEGTIDVSDINIYYTGASNTFSNTNMFGSELPADGTIHITGNQQLLSGTNYFWVTYDISAAASGNNVVDAECTQIHFNGSTPNQNPDISAPDGNREILIIPPDYNMNNTSETTCYGIFHDSGGSTANYSDNETYIKTFCSNNGTNLRFDFNDFDVNIWDLLWIYDGPTTSDLIIGRYTNSGTIPKSIISSGTCLTFKFTSDVITNKAGWNASISCFDKGICGVTPPASDLCANAPLLSTMDGICGSTGGYTASDLSGTNLQSETCSSVQFIDNNSWLKFIAEEESAELAIVCNCEGSGLEISVFETTDCINFVEKGCYNPFYNHAPGVFKVDGLTIGNTYHIMIDQFSNPGCNFQINGLKGVVLPVEMKHLNANCFNGYVNINWTTASESNNDFFTIERSINAIDFTPIAQINGQGNSITDTEYNFTDSELIKLKNYYRIKQTDYDGNFSYSKILFVDCSTNKPNTLSVFPNPTNDNINLTFNRNIETDYEYMITDCYGRIQLKGKLQHGNKFFKIDIKQSLENGIYTLSIFSENATYKEIIIKN